MLDLSIIIVNYKNQHLITQCVQSIVDCETALDYEIIVVDNDSQDDAESVLKKICPRLRWFQMGYNSGFGRANNVGIREAKGEYLLLLNSDVVVKQADTLRHCIDYLNSLPHPDKTVLGTRLVNPDGSYQETLRLEFPGIKREIKANPLYILFFERLMKREKIDKDEQKHAHYRSGEVAWINGAFLLMNRSSAMEKKLLFDEDFFLYGEDVEWCWRVHKSGMKFIHWHVPELIHIGSASMPSNMFKRSQIIISDWLYLKKSRSVFYLFSTLVIVCFTTILNAFFYKIAQVRGRKIDDSSREEVAFRRILVYLMKRYGTMILFKKKLSSKTEFLTNCYADAVITEKTK